MRHVSVGNIGRVSDAVAQSAAAAARYYFQVLVRTANVSAQMEHDRSRRDVQRWKKQE